jgi:transposase
VEASVAGIDAEIAAALASFRGVVARLVTIPGISTTAATVVVAEIGGDMTRFPTAGHLRSWAGRCPRLDESAGKHGSRRIRHGAPWLKPVLVAIAARDGITEGLAQLPPRLRPRAADDSAGVAER